MKNKMKLATLAVLAADVVFAMPTKQEIASMRPLVSELMASAVSELKAKTKTPVDVADTAVGFAESAKSEAAQYLFLRGAIVNYVKGGEYGKAADAVERLKAKVKDMPPSEIASLISNAFGRSNVSKSPRLYSQLQLAQAQTKAAKDANSLAESFGQKNYDPPRRRQYAEALAVCGNWNLALAEFAKLSEAAGKIARRELSDAAKSLEIGDFWWSYETCYSGGEIMFREHAANYYRRAIAEGKVDGLKKTLVEQRLASLVLPDVDNAVVGDSATKNTKDTQADASAGRAVSTKPSSVGSRVPRDRAGRPGSPLPAAKDASGLVHRWSFTDGLSDSVGNVAPSKSDNAEAADGKVALRSGSPLVFPAGTVPLAPFTVQVWASATDKGLGSDDDFIFKIAATPDGKDDSVFWTWTASGKKWASRIGGLGEGKKVGHGKLLLDGQMHLYTVAGEKSGKGLSLKFYQDDTLFGELTSNAS